MHFFHLGPFVPSVKDCSTHLVLELLLAPDVANLLLQLFGIIYLVWAASYNEDTLI